MKTIHIKLILFLAFCPFWCLAQNSELKMISDSLFEHAVQLYHQQDYQAAIQDFQKCDAIDEQYMDPVLNRREYVRNWVSHCYYMLGDEEQAKTLSNYYQIEPIDRKLTEISDSLAIIAFQYSMNADYANALQYGLECLRQELLMIGESNYTAANSYYFIADCYAGLNDYENAISYCKKSLSIRQQVLGDQSIDYLSSLYSLTIIYDLTNETDSTIKYGTQAKELYSKLIGTNDAQYCDLLDVLYYSFIDKKDSSKAIQIGEELTLLIKNLKGVNTEDYYYSMSSLASQYLDIDNSRVLEIREELLPVIEKLYGKGSEGYSFNLDVLSQLYYDAQNYTNCVKYGEEFLKYQNVDSINSNTVLRILANVAFSYNMLNDYHSAIPHLLKVNELLCDTSAVYLGLLASCYGIDGNYKQAAFWGEKYLEALKDKNSNEYVGVLDLLLTSYEELGDYQKSIEIEEELVANIERQSGKFSGDYIYHQNSLANKYSSIDNEHSILIREELLPVITELYGQESEEYVWELYSLAVDYLSSKNYVECIKCSEAIVDSHILDEARRHQVLFNLGSSYININQPDKALPFLERACAMEDYTTPYESYFLSHCYSSVGKFMEAIARRKVFIDYAEQKTDKETQLLYAQALDITAIDYVGLEDYQNAIDFQKQCWNVHSKMNEFDLAIKDLGVLALYYSMSGNHNKAIETRIEYHSLISERQESEYQIAYARSLSSMIHEYRSIGDYEKALSCGLLAYDLFKKYEYSDNHRYYLLGNLARLYVETGYHDKALRYYSEAAELSELLYGPGSGEHAKALASLAKCYSDTKDYLKADSLEMVALSIAKGQNIASQNLIGVLTELASIKSNERKYDEAIDYYNQALSLIKETEGELSIDYGDNLSQIADQYKRKYEYEKAISLYRKGLGIIELDGGGRDFRYEHHQLMLATLYEEIGNYKASLDLLNKSLELSESCYGRKSDAYVFVLARLSTHYLLMDEYDSSLSYAEQSLAISKELYGENSDLYAKVLSNIAIIYDRLGDYKQAILVAEKALSIKKSISGEYSEDYIITLGNISSIYSNLGDVRYALKIDLKIKELRKSLYGENHLLYAIALNQLGLDYYRINDFENARLCLEKAYEIRKRILGTEHPDVAISLNNLALVYYFSEDDYQKAINVAEQANEIIRTFFGEDHFLYSLGLRNLSLYYTKKDVNVAIELLLKANRIGSKVLGPEHIDNGWGSIGLAKYYFLLGDFNEAIDQLMSGTHVLTKHILNYLNLHTSASRNDFWNKFSDVFDAYLPAYVYYANRKDLSPSLYDESALFSKGLLLNTERSIRDIILESNDSSIIEKFTILQLNQGLLAKQYELPLAQRYLNEDSLLTLIRIQEKELLAMSEQYGNYTRGLNIKWEDVQQSLSDKDLAVEFLSFRAKNDSVMYIALTLDKEDSIPMMIPLFEKKQLDSISDKDYYRTEALYNLIWKPLEQELEGKENVYFSPAGALHNIGIEYLPIDSTINIADKYNLIRLSSTRELVIRHGTKAPTKAVLYGGLLYNIDPELIQEDNQANNYGPRYALMMRGLEDSLNTRSDFSSLGYTLREVESINELLTNERLTTKLFTKYNGTEESFKSLDGQGINILHLATHGAYIPDQDAAKKKDEKNYRFIRLDDGNSQSVIEDQSLTRSFLVMSGGNMLIHGDSIPEGLDDGILTAQEISRLDLRGLDLVVLSACETALGDITSEGVMGLQRGFKKAGAQTIVMSLWKVADEQTMQFMTEFYRLLSLGSGKRQAFKGAQQYLREAYPEQSEKPFWSAFIMLD